MGLETCEGGGMGKKRKLRMTKGRAAVVLRIIMVRVKPWEERKGKRTS